MADIVRRDPCEGTFGNLRQLMDRLFGDSMFRGPTLGLE